MIPDALPLAAAPKREGATTVVYPACINGHRKLMRPDPVRHAYKCDECEFTITRLQWARYLENAA